MYLKPAHSHPVTDPERGDHLPADGRQVQPTQYWQRRLLDGDVIEATPPTPPQATQE